MVFFFIAENIYHVSAAAATLSDSCNNADAQGNYVTISYVSNQGPNISLISDTMNRSLVFNYTSGLLTEITAPGLTVGSTRTLVRMEYQPLTLNYSFSLTPHVCASTVNVLKAIYYPATNTGYWFGDTDSYSGYGMITKIQECRNMSYSNGVISKNSNSFYTSREMIYEYQTSGTLTAEPTYTKMKEKWVAMDTTAPGITQSGPDTGYAVTNFEVVNEPNNIRRRATITRPDGSKQVSYAWVNTSGFDDGLVFYTKTCGAGQPCDYNDMGLRSTSITWQMGDYSSPRIGYFHSYDLSYTSYPYIPKLTSLTYGSYNQVTEVQEWGYDGVLKRKTATTYENGANYVNRHIFNLAKTVETRDANNVALSRIEYNYDQTTPSDTTAAVTHHDPTYDPYTTQQYCYPVYDEWGTYLYDNCYSVFDTSTLYRGNVTTVKRYPTPGSTVGLITETRAYDKTGNVITAATGCCQQTTFTYTSNTQFAYPETQTRGSATDPTQRVTTSAVWNANTGLMEQARDANQLATIYQYYSDTLRPQYVWSPTGAYKQNVYDDTGLVVYDRLYFSDDLNGGLFTMAEGTDSYLDGQGRIHGEVAYGSFVNGQYEIDVVASEYDGNGRLYKQTRPYRNGGTQYWSNVTYDALDRITQVTAPDGSTTKHFYDEIARPSVASSEYGATIRTQDEWGRERWARFDWDRKIVEVVEPDPNAAANIGSVLNGTGYKTAYQYDLLGNLTQTQQGDQTRTFKYDGLSRLVAQKLAERSATLDDSGNAGSLWSDVFIYDDRSNLTNRIDARRVQTIFDYQSDPLDRLKEMRYVTTNAIAPPSGMIHAAPTTTYTYEAGANLDKMRLTVVTVAGVVTDGLVYDPYGRVKDVTRTFNDNTARPLVTSYLYDKADRVREVTYPAQYPSTTRKIAKLNYDDASRTKELLFGGQSLASAFVYNAESQATTLKVGYNTGANEIKEEYSYNPQNGLLTNQLVKKNPTTPAILLNLSYDYAKVGGGAGITGQLTKITNNLDPAKNRFYEYDALARLKKAKGGSIGTDWWQDYGYDRYGNRTSVTKTGNIPLDAINPGGSQNSFALSFANGQGQNVDNRIKTVIPNDYQYDNAGNITRGQDTDGTWQRFEYDAANRLKCVKNDAGTTTLATYTYGASNQRLKAVDGVATNTWYLLEGSKVIAEYNDAAGNVSWAKNYVYLGDRLLATESTTLALQFHHPDRLGSRLVTNASNGTSAGEQESLPFGTAIGAGITGNQRRFTSYDRSNTTKQDDAVNRSYNAGLGRFTQVDPIGMGAVSLANPQSLNLYGYCFNDPINFLDPDGLDPTGGALIIFIITSVTSLLRAIFGGKKPQSTLIIKNVTFRENRPNTTRSIWTNAGISAGVGAVNNFIQRSRKKAKWIREIRDEIIFDNYSRKLYRRYGRIAKSVQELYELVNKKLSKRYGEITTAGSTDSSGNVTVAEDENPYTKEATKQHEETHRKDTLKAVEKYGKDTEEFNKWWADPKVRGEMEYRAYSADVRSLNRSLRILGAKR